jgi:hypothetical protein
MTAGDHLSDQQFEEARRWQQGQCGTYACTLQSHRPELKIGMAGNLEHDEHGTSFPYEHIFAHDETHAYDSLGAHPLPYKGTRNQWGHNELGHKSVDEAGIDPLYEEHGPEGPHESVRLATERMRKLGQIK